MCAFLFDSPLSNGNDCTVMMLLPLLLPSLYVMLFVESSFPAQGSMACQTDFQ
jgi:hypothetical protein